MTVAEILAELASLGNPSVYAHNLKFGAGTNQFGVKMGDIRILAKRIKTNHALALELWKTDPIEAQLLACLLLKPKLLSREDLEQMVLAVNSPQVSDWFSSYVVKEYADKEGLRLEWLASTNKWANRLAWSLTAGRISRGAEGMDLDQLLQQLEVEMPLALPEVQWTMNFALAYIGIHHPAYRTRAVDLGERLGLYRDYPVSKGCTSPFVPIWVREIVSR